MASQNNSGRQFNKRHSITLIAAALLAANRFVAYDGNYATNAGGVHDAQGISETSANIGEALSVVDDYSYLVEAEGNIAFGDYVKAGTDGKAAVGTQDEHCGRALGVAAAGQLVEVQFIYPRHAAA